MARVLVIDDENNIRLMVRIALQAAGHTVETAADGTEGLDRFGDGSEWDVVLLDQRMPDIEGLTVLREMRKRDNDARVLMITAFGTVDLTNNAMKAGACNFLRKPFTTEVLRGAVLAALEAPPHMPANAGPAVSHEDDPPQLRPTSINGFRIELALEVPPEAESTSPIQYGFVVRGPADSATAHCTVVLPGYFVELVKAHADREILPNAGLFWQWLCEESLANYLWQHAEVPPGGILRVEELTSGMRRWVDAVLTR